MWSGLDISVSWFQVLIEGFKVSIRVRVRVRVTGMDLDLYHDKLYKYVAHKLSGNLRLIPHHLSSLHSDERYLSREALDHRMEIPLLLHLILSGTKHHTLRDNQHRHFW